MQRRRGAGTGKGSYGVHEPADLSGELRFLPDRLPLFLPYMSAMKTSKPSPLHRWYNIEESRRLFTFAFAGLALVACSEELDGEEDVAQGSGGSGVAASGGGEATGGQTVTGGTSPAGGRSAGGVASAGGSASGGQTSSGGATTGGIHSGGAMTTGGSSSGGAESSGGASSGGMAPTGGASGTGGAGGADSSDRCSVGVWDGEEPEVLSLSGNTFAHDPTMVKADGVYYRFWTGPGVPSARSTDLRNWQNAPEVYDDGYSDWVDPWLSGVPGETFNFPWAPDVTYFNGEYHLYSSFSAIFGDNISCITHLSTTDIASGDWVDHGPVICTEGNENFNAIDADVELDEEGTPWFSFGSFWDGIMAFKLNPDGSRAEGGEMTRLAWANQIEAPVLLRRCGYYYLFVTWGLCCPGEGRSVNDLTYRVAVGRSENIMGPYVDKNGVELVDGGGSLLVEGDGVTWAAAGHSDVLVDGDKIYHLYHAYRQADAGAELRIVELPFDEEGWPVAGGP